MAAVPTIAEIVERLLPLFQRPDIRLIVLFGSRAKVRARPSSDVDLGILVRNAASGFVALERDAVRLLATDRVDGWPNVETHISYGLGPAQGQGLLAQRPFEFGVSGLIGQVRTEPFGTTEIVADIWGVGLDLHWQINDHFGLNGELFTGQGLGSYTAGISQTTNTDTEQAIRTSGGFVEVYCYLTDCLHSHWGYGIDDPIDIDVAPGQRLRNQAYFSNLLWDVTPLFRVGFEFTWRETDYLARIDNEGAGFHTQFQWKF